MYDLTIVIPIYNEQATIKCNIESIITQLEKDEINALLILIDDGSKDGSWPIMCELSKCSKRIISMRLSRNFGKEVAVLAGISKVNTEYCLVMDSDLQHPPRYIKEFLNKIKETGADIVEGIKAHRGKESVIYKLLAKTYYKLLAIATGVNLENSSDFKLFNHKVVEALGQFNEGNVFFRGIIEYCGFTKEQIEFTVDERKNDKSKFSKRTLIKFSVNSVISHSGKPILLTFVFSFIFIVLSVIMGIQTIYVYLNGQAENGFTTVIILLLIVGAFILFSLGIIGIYIEKIYNEVKYRPRHLISQLVGKNYDIKNEN